MARSKKPRSVKRSTPRKATGTPKSVQEYAARVPEAAREMFTALRATVRSAVPPQAQEIISCGIPALADDGVLVWFAAFSNHCSLFPTASILAVFEDELKNFPTSKGTIHFPLDKPLPTGLIKKLVKARVKDKQSANRK